MHGAFDTGPLHSGVQPGARCATPGRADAEFAIAMLGPRARMAVPTETVMHFGQWLDWPDWLREGTSLTCRGPLPQTVPLSDGLIMFGNIIDNADELALVERMLTSPRPVMGSIAALQLLHAPDTGTALSSLIAAMATPNPWVLCTLEAGEEAEDMAAIAFRPPWPMGPLFRFTAIGGSALFYRAIEALHCNALDEMVLETRLAGVPEAQRLLSGFRCRVVPSSGVERLRFPRAWLATPNPHHDAMLWGVAQAKLAALVAETGEPGEVAIVRAFIVAMLEGEHRVPRLKQAAAHLGISDRTIVRSLARAGTSYHRLVEQERKARALALIANPAIPLAEVAAALGFGDMSSFGRSCRNWFGQTPGSLRKAGGSALALVTSIPPRAAA